MLLPVFARTRELAREARCLANVKNIALAIQMYLADNNDTLPPMETSPRVLDWFAANAPNWPAGATWCCYPTRVVFAIHRSLTATARAPASRSMGASPLPILLRL
jgi:hypothetical protein